MYIKRKMAQLRCFIIIKENGMLLQQLSQMAKIIIVSVEKKQQPSLKHSFGIFLIN
jgi:hypothetical protein